MAISIHRNSKAASRSGLFCANIVPLMRIHSASEQTSDIAIRCSDRDFLNGAITGDQTML